MGVDQASATADGFAAGVEDQGVVRALHEARETLELALDCASAGTYDGDMVTGALSVDERYERMLGYAPGEFPRRVDEWLALVHEDDRPVVMAKGAAVRRGIQEGFDAEYRMRHKSGAWVWVLDRGRGLDWDEEGRPRRSAGTHLDITARKQAEEALRASREKFAMAFRLSPDAYTLTRVRDETLVECNDAFCRLTGRDASELVGRTAQAAGLWASDEQQEALRERLEREGHVRTMEVLLRAKDGSLRSCEISAELLRLPDGLHRLVVAHDVTEQRRVEDQLRHSQKMEAVGQLAGGVAHDFNNILTAMLMRHELLRGVPGLPDDVREALAELEQGAQRAATLTRQLLQFSRRDPVRTGPVDLEVLIDHVTTMLRRLLGEQIELTWRRGAGPLWVDADGGLIEQVITNLCLNARDAMPDGGHLTLSCSVRSGDDLEASRPPDAPPRGAFACVSIEDTGCGMDPETRRRAFEPFFTTKGAGRGTGLGLSTAFGIVKRHGGWLEVDSEVGRGSAFRVLLPVSLSEPGRATDDVPSSPRGRGETVLVVEDEPAVRRVLVIFLQQWGYRVIEAANGPEALAQWERHRSRVDLLLSDMVMPGGMSGTDLAERLLADEPALRVVVSSGYGVHFEGGGPVDGRVRFVPKPYAPAKLAAIIRELLDTQRQ